MAIIILFSKLVRKLLRLFKLGGGTSLPGLIFERYFPHYLSTLTEQYKNIVFISGTNGKTTTQRFLAHLLESKGIKIVSNKSGANLIRGIASTIVADCNIFGKAKSDSAVFEVEEATMPHLTKLVNPNHIIITNLFRDQLDAYGEVVKTRSYLLDAIKGARQAKVFLNGDDENVSSIAGEVGNKVTFFRLRDERIKEIFYERSYYKLRKISGGKVLFAGHVKIDKDLSTSFDVYGLEETLKDIHFKSPGLLNIYNALAAIAVATQIKKFKLSELRSFSSLFAPAFGRGEVVKINGKQIRLLLIKNPVSFSANLDMLKNILNLKLMVIINDKIADGRDVSWLWDSKVEVLKNAQIAWMTISGRRAFDMLLRLKYAEIKTMGIEVEPNIVRALDISLSKLGNGETLFILPTYTAMLEVRKAIGNIVKIREFWK